MRTAKAKRLPRSDNVASASQRAKRLLAERDHGRQVTRTWLIWRVIASSRNGMSHRQIHAELEEPCSERNMFRDLVRLENLGFIQRGENGLWKALRAPDTGVPIEQTEVTALLVAMQRLTPLGDAWLGGSLKGLLTKALASLNEVRRAGCHEAAQMILADPRASVRYDRHAETLSTLEFACLEQQKVLLRHKSGGAPARDRIVEPRRLVYRDGGIYLVARDSAASQHKKFAVHRIETADLLDEDFVPDPEFDPDRYINESFGLFHGERVHAIVEFDAAIAHLPAERSFHPSQKLEPLPNGSVRVEFDIAGTTDLVRWLAGFGPQVRVVEPHQLRQELTALHRNALAGGE